MSSTLTMATPLRRLGSSEQNSASQSLYAFIDAVMTSPTGTPYRTSPWLGYSTEPQTPSTSFSSRYRRGSLTAGRTSANAPDVRRSCESTSNRSPVWIPRNDMVLYPSTYHQSPSSRATTRGSRSWSAPPRPAHRSGGSMTWESDEMSQVRPSTSAVVAAATSVMSASQRHLARGGKGAPRRQ